MSIIQVAAATKVVDDAELALVEAFKPLLREAAYRELPHLRKMYGERAGEYARKLEYYISGTLRECYKHYGYSPKVMGMLDAFLMSLFVEVHKEEFICG